MRWEAGGAVGSAWAGSIRRRRRPRHQLVRPKCARLSGGLGRSRPKAPDPRGFRCQNKRRTSLLGAAGEGKGGSALASGKCSCLWLRACSLAQQRGPLLVLSGVFRRRSATRSEDAG